MLDLDTAAQHLAVHYGALGQWQAIRDDPDVYRHESDKPCDLSSDRAIG